MQGGLLVGVVLMVLEVIMVVLGVVLVVVHGAQSVRNRCRNRQCSERCSEPTEAITNDIKKAVTVEMLLRTYHAHQLSLNQIHLSACWVSLSRLLQTRPGLHAPRAVKQQYSIRQVPTYPIFCAVKATILGHILAPLGGGLGGFWRGFRRFFCGSWAS